MRLVKLELEVDSTASDNELEAAIKENNEFVLDEPDDYGTKMVRVRSIEINELED